MICIKLQIIVSLLNDLIRVSEIMLFIINSVLSLRAIFNVIFLCSFSSRLSKEFIFVFFDLICSNKSPLYESTNSSCLSSSSSVRTFLTVKVEVRRSTTLLRAKKAKIFVSSLSLLLLLSKKVVLTFIACLFVHFCLKISFVAI